jgi:hypothetical protein
MMEKWFDFGADNFIIAVAATVVLSGVSVGDEVESLIERMRPPGGPGDCE